MLSQMEHACTCGDSLVDQGYVLDLALLTRNEGSFDQVTELCRVSV